jgi:holo-[acyl-carrier protein] synthase
MRIGCDLVYVPRFAISIEQKRFIDKVFHENEVAACEAKVKKEESYAARFAAKEAFAKAWGTGLFGEGTALNEVWVDVLPNGRPQLVVSERVRSALEREGIRGWDVSLAHHGEYAMATVLLFAGN